MLTYLFQRYLDCYRVCKWLIRTGNIIRFLGFVGTLTVYYYAYEYVPTLPGFHAFVLWLNTLHLTAIQGDFFALTVGLIILSPFIFFEVVATLLSGFGQTVRAIVDIAVNTSPLLSLEEKLTIVDTSSGNFLSKLADKILDKFSKTK